MKTILACTFLFLLGSSLAQARVGETLDQVINRYGTAEKRDTVRLPGAEGYNFTKNNLAVEVVILQGKSVMEVFNHHNGPVITDEEIKSLLKTNGEDHNWAFDRRTNQWLRSDGKLAAYREPDHPDFFFIEDIAAAKEARKKAVLEGF